MQRVHKASRSDRIQGTEAFNDSATLTQAEFDSFYDPLDFYSGDPKRIQRALRALCEDWAHNRANNLHIWCRGKQLFLPGVSAYF